jgi:formylglycine-generating enzyme required for sulfatase activity
MALAGAVALLGVVVGVLALLASHGVSDPKVSETKANDSKVSKDKVDAAKVSDSRQGTMLPRQDGSADRKPTEPLPKRFTNRLGMEFVLVPKGKSWLGGGGGKPGDKDVVIAYDFYLGKYEVTQAEWHNIMGNNPSHFSRSGNGKDAVQGIADEDLQRFPVESVTWDDARAFVAEVNKRLQESGWEYRLPTEVEWEYACRGGPLADQWQSAFDWYFDQPTNQLLPEQANYDLKRSCQVGSYRPNPLGLYDMHGNVWEWCDDTVIDTRNLLHLEFAACRTGRLLARWSPLPVSPHLGPHQLPAIIPEQRPRPASRPSSRRQGEPVRARAVASPSRPV